MSARRDLTFSRSFTDHEQRFADWADTNGLDTLWSRMFPIDDSYDFEPFDVVSLSVERKTGDEIVAFVLDCGSTAPAEVQWPMLEQLARAGLERTIEERT